MGQVARSDGDRDGRMVGQGRPGPPARLHRVILYLDEGVAAKVGALTGGAGVPVVCDSVRNDTYETSLASLARRDLFLSFGNASGPVPPLSPQRPAQAGSVFFTQPSATPAPRPCSTCSLIAGC
jgi:NADPH:quinone reductase-like Zn-dependent oxidoreductase